MKKYIFILWVMLAAVACEPNPVEMSNITEEEADAIIAQDVPGSKLYTLNEFMDKYMTEKGNYMSDTALYRQRAVGVDGVYLFSIDTLPTQGPGIYIRGRITTDDFGGNFYKALVIQEMVGGQQQALRISIDASSASGQYPLGQLIQIRVNGFAIGRYANQPQLCVPSNNNNIYAQKYTEKVGWAPGRIPMARFAHAVTCIGLPDVNALHYDEYNIMDFIYNIDQQDVRYWDGKLVRLSGIHFTGQYVDSKGNMLDCTVYDASKSTAIGNPEKDTNAKVFAPTTNNVGYPQGRVITDGFSYTLVSTSEYAKYAYFYLPDAEYVGTVEGILSYYRDNAGYSADQWDWAITPRNINDIKLEGWTPIEFSK